MSDRMGQTRRGAFGRLLRSLDDRLRAVEAPEQAPPFCGGGYRTGLGLPRAAIAEMAAAKALDRAQGVAGHGAGPAGSGEIFGAEVTGGIGRLGVMGLRALVPEFARARALVRLGPKRHP